MNQIAAETHQPILNWVRLAQRVPVRIRLDRLAPGQTLVAGTTCTVVLLQAGAG